MEIDIFLEEGLEGCLEATWLEGVASRLLLAQGVASNAELSLVIVGQERIRKLNWSYLGEDEPTDVLAFSFLEPDEGIPFALPPDGIKHLGEVIISYPQAVLQAQEHQHSVKREVAILLIHGVLHLLGYEHDKPELEHEMRTREAEILSHIAREIE